MTEQKICRVAGGSFACEGISELLDFDVCNEGEPRQAMRVLKYKPGVAKELLCRCKYFEVYRMLINTERRQHVTFSSESFPSEFFCATTVAEISAISLKTAKKNI
ncbi:MAG: hypothetical protein IKQ00_10140 [Butyrivibrio sp.]|nr:hypothetical protein [Butyrivibrio sp.]MBR4640229.1 hypothetical protein [Butyrivibrio sp.]